MKALVFCSRLAFSLCLFALGLLAGDFLFGKSGYCGALILLSCTVYGLLRRTRLLSKLTTATIQHYGYYPSYYGYYPSYYGYYPSYFRLLSKLLRLLPATTATAGRRLLLGLGWRHRYYGGYYGGWTGTGGVATRLARRWLAWRRSLAPLIDPHATMPRGARFQIRLQRREPFRPPR